MIDPLEKLTYNLAENFSEKIDSYAKSVFNIPHWVRKRHWLFRLYLKLYELKIEKHQRIDLMTEYRFFKNNKKVGEIKIKD